VIVGTTVARDAGRRLSAGEATGMLLYRNYLAYRGAWYIFATGFLEPVFYLFSIGVGVGKLVHGFEFHGHPIAYADFVAPGMMAAAAMQGALLDSTFNFFFKLRYNKLFDSILATPMTTLDVARGELAWCLLRGGIYSTGFLVIMLAMGMVHSWWALLAVPATLLLALATAGVGMAMTTYMKSWQDFDYVILLHGDFQCRLGVAARGAAPAPFVVTSAGEIEACRCLGSDVDDADRHDAAFASCSSVMARP